MAVVAVLIAVPAFALDGGSCKADYPAVLDLARRFAKNKSIYPDKVVDACGESGCTWEAFEKKLVARGLTAAERADYRAQLGNHVFHEVSVSESSPPGAVILDGGVIVYIEKCSGLLLWHRK